MAFRDASDQASSLKGINRDLMLVAADVIRFPYDFVDKDELLRQIPQADQALVPDALEHLASLEPPLIDCLAETVTLTEQGRLVALRLAQFEVDAADMEPSHSIKRLRPPMSNNKEMAEYASAVGGSFKRDRNRCSFCRHDTSIYVKKGGTILCQLCYGRGDRPWTSG